MIRTVVCVLAVLASFQVFAAESPAERRRAQSADLADLEARHAERSVIEERRLLQGAANGAADDTDRLKVAQAYVLEAPSSPSKLDAAWAHVSAVLEQNPSNVQALLLAGQIGMLRGQPGQAQVHYQAAALADPSNASAFLGLGETWSRLGDEGEASKAYDQYRRLRGMPVAGATGTGRPVAIVPGQEPPRVLNRSLVETPPARKNRK